LEYILLRNFGRTEILLYTFSFCLHRRPRLNFLRSSSRLCVTAIILPLIHRNIFTILFPQCQLTTCCSSFSFLIVFFLSHYAFSTVRCQMMFRTGRYGRHLANDPRFRCCGCCHVQTGAVCLGLYNITLQCFALCFLIFTVVNPDVFFELNVKQGLLQSGYNESYELDDFNKIGIHERLPELPTPVPQNSFSLADNDHHAGFVPSRAEVLVITRRRLRPADAHLAIALVFGLMFITSMMIYGIFKPDLPFRDQLAGLNSQWIAICILLFYLLIIVVKIYFIGIVWSCYQFLQAANADNMRLDDPKADMDNVQVIFTPTEIVETTVKLPPAYDELPPQYTAAYFPYAR
ncbi:Lysosomal-associated transmembrane protein 4A, partial [Trichinella britovi]